MSTNNSDKATRIDPSHLDKNDAIELYKMVVSLRNYEGTLLWTRNQIFLIVNSISMLFQAFVLKSDMRNDVESMAMGAAITIVGIIVSLTWIFSIQRSEVYDSYWSATLKKLENEHRLYPLFSGIQSFMNTQPSLRRSLKIGTIAKIIAGCFLVIWALVLTFYIRH